MKLQERRLKNLKREYKFTIPLPPRTKKNSSQVVKCGNSTKVLPSKAYERYSRLAKQYIPCIPTIDYPVNVAAVFYTDSTRPIDLANLLNGLDDILKDNKVVLDDNSDIIYSHDGSYVVKKDRIPRTVITITERERNDRDDSRTE